MKSIMYDQVYLDVISSCILCLFRNFNIQDLVTGLINIYLVIIYGIVTEELVIREIRIEEAVNSRMTILEVIMLLKLQSTMKTQL